MMSMDGCAHASIQVRPCQLQAPVPAPGPGSDLILARTGLILARTGLILARTGRILARTLGISESGHQISEIS